MAEATHAVAVRVRIDDPEAAANEVHERIAPRASAAPGFVSGCWTRKDDTGLALILFDSADGAEGAIEMIRSAPPESVEIENVELREVFAQA